MAKKIITAEDLYKMQLITDLEIAPDGKKAILSVQEVNHENEKKFSNLWMLDLQTGKTTPFTSGKTSISSPRWSPDGDTILFISNRDDEKQPQLYTISANGGEATKLTSVEGEFDHISWSPDGMRIICQFRKKDSDAILREKNEKLKELGITVREIERTFYRLDGYGWYPQERWHLWEINPRDGQAKQLSDHKIYDETGPFLSPDSSQIGFFSNRSDDPDLNPAMDDLFVYELKSGVTRKIGTPPGNKSFGAFSPDGKWIAYIGQIGIGEDWRNSNLWVVDSEGQHAAINMTEQYDVHVSSSTLNDNGPLPFVAPIWSLDGQSIFIQISKHGNTGLHKINVKTRQLENVIVPSGVIGKPTFDRQQQVLLYLLGSPNTIPQVYKSLAIDNFSSSRQLTHFNEAWLKQIDLELPEEVWFKGSDGNDLQGWILKPPGFDASQKYPSIMEIHGGPLAQYGNLWMHEFYYLASKGYVVYYCNPRGGQGYGEAHSSAIHDGKWGTKDYEDLMCWADTIEKLPYIDPNRMGVTGGSYGGYMTTWIIGHTQRFNAAVTQRCVSNLISMWGSSDFNWAFQETFGNKAPYEDIEILWECSPIKHIGAAKTPTLVIHSEQDLRCPLEQGQQVFVALKKLGVPTKFVIFPDEPHGLSRVGRTDRRVIRLHQISGWFDQYLK